MITAYIIYPKSEGSTFDMEYYTKTHMPMLADALGDACKMWGATEAHGEEYHAIGWVNVESMDAWQTVIAGDEGTKILADVPNYTTVQPALVTGESIV